MEPSSPDTRTALLQAALACFAERGFDGTSLRMIADRAQRPLSLLSHHFGNKEGLYVEVFKMMLESPVFKKHPAPEQPGTPRDKHEAIRMLRELIHSVYQEGSPDIDLHDPLHELGSRLFLQEIRSPRPSLHPLLTVHMAPRTDTIKSCIRMLRPDLDEAEVAFTGCSILGQVIGHGLLRGMLRVAWGEFPPPGSPFQASELLVDLSLNGLLGVSRSDK
jgi:AcrR family transcriptional regulator